MPSSASAVGVTPLLKPLMPLSFVSNSPMYVTYHYVLYMQLMRPQRAVSNIPPRELFVFNHPVSLGNSL